MKIQLLNEHDEVLHTMKFDADEDQQATTARKAAYMMHGITEDESGLAWRDLGRALLDAVSIQRTGAPSPRPSRARS